MSLETATFIDDLVPTNPQSTDLRKQGDDHLRLIKSALQNTFPNADRAFYLPHARTVIGATELTAADDNGMIFVNTDAGQFNITLPISCPTGYRVNIVKFQGTAPCFVVFPGQTSLEGFVASRVDVPFISNEFFFTGSKFVRLRPPGELPPGSMILFSGGYPPVGYDFPYGQSLLRTAHPELFAAWGTYYGAADSLHFNAPDYRGYVFAGRDNMGGSSADRITLELDGDVLGAAGGLEVHTLTAGEIPAHTHPVTVPGVAHKHVVKTTQVIVQSGTGQSVLSQIGAGAVLADTDDATPTTQSLNTGNNTPGIRHNNMQPTRIVNYIFRLC